PVPAERVPAWHKYRVSFDPAGAGYDAPPVVVRDALCRALVAEGVEAVLWQTKPVPGQELFQRRIGFGLVAGGGAPRRRRGDGAPVSYDLGQSPETQRLLDGSVVLFSHSFPIAGQPTELVEAYAEAFAKVWGQLDQVLPMTGSRGERARTSPA